MCAQEDAWKYIRLFVCVCVRERESITRAYVLVYLCANVFDGVCKCDYQ